MGLAGPLILLADDILRVWLHKEYPLAVDVARVFLVVTLILMARAPMMLVLESSMRGVRIAGSLVAAETIANLGIGIALLGVMGPRGLVLGTLVAVAATTLLGLGPAALRTVGVSGSALVRRTLLPVASPLCFALPLWLGVRWLVHGRGLVVVLSGIVVAVLADAILVWRTLTTAEKADLRPAFRA